MWSKSIGAIFPKVFARFRVYVTFWLFLQYFKLTHHGDLQSRPLMLLYYKKITTH